MTNVTPLRRGPETTAQAIARQHRELQVKARQAAADVHNDLTLMCDELRDLAALESLPPGAREAYRRLAEHVAGELQSAILILGRVN